MADFWANIKNRWERKPFEIGWDDYIALAIALLGILGFINGPIPFIPGWTEAYYQIRAELIGIGITVFIIGNANEAVKTRQAKELLILQMGSPDNAFAVEAVRQLRARGCLYDGSLRGAKLDYADLNRVVLYGANLSEANLSRAILVKANLENAILIRANLGGAKMIEARLWNADLTRANLGGVDFTRAKLCWADLSSASLMGANLCKADLSRADLSRTDLRLADLREADISEANLEGAMYDASTRWPDGFDYEEAGAYRSMVA